MKKIKVSVVVVLIFSLGLSVGVIGSNYFHRKKVKEFARLAPKGRFEFFMRYLEKTLRFDADQSARVKMVLEQSWTQIEAIKKEAEPRINVILAEEKNRLRQIMTEQQLEKFNELISQLPPPPPSLPKLQKREEK